MTEINLTPNFDRLRLTFEREARLKAEGFANRLAPPCDDTTLETWNEQKLAILNAVHQLLVPIAMVAECSTSLDDILGLRELTHYAMTSIRQQYERVEEQIAEAAEPEVPAYEAEFKSSDGYTLFRLENDGEKVWVDSLVPANIDLEFESDLDGWPIINGERMEGKYISLAESK